MKKTITQRGFTYIEILVVISIIGLLFFFLIPQVNGFLMKSRESGIRTDFRSFHLSSDNFFRETAGKDMQVDSLNLFLDVKHRIRDTGTIMQTESKDPWGSHYEVEFDLNKITFSSYGEEKNPANKTYKLVTYYENGFIDSCTIGFGTNNLNLTKIKNTPAGFVCGDPLSLPPSEPSGTLTAPQNFRTISVSNTKAELAWDNVVSATRYILKRNELIIYIGNNITFSDITLSAGNTYMYSVAAQIASDISPYATLNVMTTIPISPPNFTASNVTESTVDLSWSKVDSATNYILKRDGTVIYTGNNLIHKDVGLAPSTTYLYSLTAQNDIGESISVPLNVTTTSPPPDPPTNFRTTNITENSIDLTWDNSLYATNYILKRGGTIIYTGNNANYNNTGLTSDTNYSYSLTAKNNAGESSPVLLNAQTKKYKGIGTSANPYLIYDCFDLQNVNNNLTAYYQLANNIDCASTVSWNSGLGFDPIGDSGARFSGFFDGKNHKISNLFINRPLEDYIGLFGYVNSSSTSQYIQNIGLENVNITGKNYVGSMFGYTVNGYLKINKNYSTGFVRGNNYVGGLIGYNYNSEVIDSYSHAQVEGIGYVGGLIGYANMGGTAYKNSYAVGSVFGASNVGGLSGYNGYASANRIYWDIDTSSVNSSALGSGKTTSEMKQQMTFTGWDFASVWIIDPAFNHGYPYLRSNIPTKSNDFVSLGAIPLSENINFKIGYYGSDSGMNYKLYRDNSLIYSGTSQNFNDTGLIHNTEYTYKVELYNDSNVLIDSKERKFKTKVMDTGLGTEYNPYIIYNVVELQRMNSCLTCFYELGANIDASSTSAWNLGAGFEPIGKNGNLFAGYFDGKNYKISNLYIVRPTEDYVGLFGSTGDGSYYYSIKNVGLENVYIRGKNYVGALAGSTNHEYINNTYTTGFVYGADYVGGMIGYNRGADVDNAYSHVQVNGSRYVGGFSGYSSFGGPQYRNTYSTGFVNGTSNMGGFKGYQQGTGFYNSYWDTETSGTIVSDGGIGKTTNEMKQQTTFTSWNFTSVWEINAAINNGYPYLKGIVPTKPNDFVSLGGNVLSNNINIIIGYHGSYSGMNYKLYRDNSLIYSGTSQNFNDIGLIHNNEYTYKVEMYNDSNVLIDSKERKFKTKVMDTGLGIEYDPYIIYNVVELQRMNSCLTCYYELGDNIDASSTSSWNSGFGFEPIGKNGNLFAGNFDGKNYKVNYLYINRPTDDYVGLFGYTGDGSYYYSIKNVGLENLYIRGKNNVGALAGSTNHEYISNVYATGFVYGTDYVGGMIGYNRGADIANAYSHVQVNGSRYVGGFSGYSSFGGPQYRNTYSTGYVSGTSNVGGFKGYQQGTGFYNSYWDTETSGTIVSNGGIGKTTFEMKQQSTFTSWNFTSVWEINPAINNGYPYLKGIVPTKPNDFISLGGNVLSNNINIIIGNHGSDSGMNYKLYRDNLLIYSGTNQNFNDTGLIHNTEYTYKVELYNNSNVLIDSKERKLKTKVMDTGIGTEYEPYIIYNVVELQRMNSCLTCFYELGANIDANDTSTWNSGAGFEPIGNGGVFSGNFDGKNYKINYLYINRPTEDYVGLFGNTSDGSYYYSIKNVGLENVHIRGKNNVGALTGSTNHEYINNVYVSGFVYGTDYVGGMIGYNRGADVANAYSHAQVNGTRYVGGFSGYSSFGGPQYRNTYSTGYVNGTSNVGGFKGYQQGTGFYNSYWDTETSGTFTSYGGIGKTTSEMKQQLTFTSWDFTIIWAINPSINNGYPYLKANIPQ